MNPFRQMLRAHGAKPPIGTWVMSASPIVAEAVGSAGFEWGVIVTERVAERKHEISGIFCLIFETNLVEAADAFFVVQMLVGFDDERKFLPGSALGVESSGWAEFKVCRTGQSVNRAIIIARVRFERLQISEDGRFQEAGKGGSFGRKTPGSRAEFKIHLNDLAE